MARLAPFELIDRDFNDLIRRTFGDFGAALTTQAGRRWAPPMDVFTRNDELHVRLEAPGIDPEQDLDIDVTDGVLKIQGERRSEHTGGEEGSGFWHREMTYGRFERAIALPRGADPENVRATYDAGILEVVVPLPKKPANKVKVEIGPTTTKKELS